MMMAMKGISARPPLVSGWKMNEIMTERRSEDTNAGEMNLWMNEWMDE